MEIGRRLCQRAEARHCNADNTAALCARLRLDGRPDKPNIHHSR
jgi:hypothetical protein